jgi:hypothetical protein
MHRLRQNAEKAGNYTFSLFNLNGSPVAFKSAHLAVGIQIIEMDNPTLKSGIYILLGEITNQKISTKIFVL